jgi:hypothetical protein
MGQIALQINKPVNREHGAFRGGGRVPINAYSARRWLLSPPHEARQKKPLESRRLGFATSLKSPEKTVGYLI